MTHSLSRTIPSINIREVEEVDIVFGADFVGPVTEWLSGNGYEFDVHFPKDDYGRVQERRLLIARGTKVIKVRKEEWQK